MSLNSFGQGYLGSPPIYPGFNINWNDLSQSGFNCSVNSLGLKGKVKRLTTHYKRPIGFGEDYLDIDTVEIFMLFNFNEGGKLTSYYSWNQDLDTNVVWLLNYSSEGKVVSGTLYTCYSNSDRGVDDCVVGEFHNWDITLFNMHYDQKQLKSISYQIITPVFWGSEVWQEITFNSKLNFHYNDQNQLIKTDFRDSVENQTLFVQNYFYSTVGNCDSIVYSATQNGYNYETSEDYVDGVLKNQFNQSGVLISSTFKADDSIVENRDFESAFVKIKYDSNGNILSRDDQDLEGNYSKTVKFGFNDKNLPVEYQFYSAKMYSPDDWKTVLIDTTLIRSEIEYKYDEFNWIWKKEVKVDSSNSNGRWNAAKTTTYFWTRNIEYY